MTDHYWVTVNFQCNKRKKKPKAPNKYSIINYEILNNKLETAKVKIPQLPKNTSENYFKKL